MFHYLNVMLFENRMVSQGLLDSSSLQIGPSRECPNLEKDLLISLVKFIKPRNSLVRKDQLPYTAGN